MGGGGGLGGEARSRGLELGGLGGSFSRSRVWLRFGRNLSQALVCLTVSVLAWSHQSSTMYRQVAGMKGERQYASREGMCGQHVIEMRDKDLVA